jgi:hypothetical protein
MSDMNYSFEIYTFNEAITPYGTLETRSPPLEPYVLDDFTPGIHFRTGPDPITKALQLEFDNRLLTILLDQSGSLTWNDQSRDRYTYLSRFLSKLESTYPGSISTNLIGFGGSFVKTFILLSASNDTSVSSDFNQLLRTSFQNSVYDFAGIRVVRRLDRFPLHPADGAVILDGIFESVKDDDLTDGTQYYYGVWTYNKDEHFSVGQFISGTPRDRILPKGVNFATATPRVLPGVARDSYTELIYNFSDRSGSIIFDSSGNGMHGILGDEVIEENFWIGDGVDGYITSDGLKKSSGVRFDGSFDIIEVSSSVGTSYVSSRATTINLWIYKNEQTAQSWVIGTSSQSPSTNVGWAIGLDTNGGLLFHINGDIVSGFNENTGVVVPTREWTMVTFVLSTAGQMASLYINGYLTSWSTVMPVADTSSYDRIYIGAKPVDNSSVWAGVDYFGALNLISIHSTIRSAEYILQLYDQEKLVFNRTIKDSAQKLIDNKQREVLISWNTESGYDYENGYIKVLRKYNSIPFNVSDGDTVCMVSPQVGTAYYLDTYNFIHNGNYYYRVFTINAMGNPCDLQESRIMSVHIPRSDNATASLLSPVSNPSVTLGNRKLYLQWTNPLDSRWRGTKIWYSKKTFPKISKSGENTIDVSDGVLLLDTTQSGFVHKEDGKSGTNATIALQNGVSYYYTILTYDEYGRYSDPAYLVGIPSSELDSAFIPEEIKNLNLSILSPNTIVLQWNNPTIKSEQLNLWMNELAVAFISIKDAYGDDLDDISNLQVQVCTDITTRDIITTEIPLDNSNLYPGGTECIGKGCVSRGYTFDANCNTPEEDAETVVQFTTETGGIIKSIVTHIGDKSVLSRREQYTMNIRAIYKIKDPSNSENNLFEFYTDGVTVSFSHPIKMSLVNKSNSVVTVSCQSEGAHRGEEPCKCLSQQDHPTCQTKTFNGGFAGSSTPYVCRCEVQYKGESLPEGVLVNVTAWKHTDNYSLNEKSTITSIREGYYSTKPILSEEIDINGNPTGRLVSKSIVDIEVPHPSLPDWIDIYVTIDYNGLFVDAVHTIRFISVLFISAEVNPALPDGIDVSEQIATVWTVNPDYPDDVSKRLPVPNDTLVKWELVKIQFGRDRPFYSTENVPISGVYSATVNGVARNVFFGPVGNMEPHIFNKSCGKDEAPELCCLSEHYAIKASATYNGETAQDSYQFFYECEIPGGFTNKRFLINAAHNQPGQWPHWVTWADGEHLLKFQIAQDAAILDDSQMLDVENFVDCVERTVGGQSFFLPLGHIVQVYAPGEILWDVIFQEDPYTGEETIYSYESISPSLAEDLGVPFVANIPIRGAVTDFYVRLNAFVGDKSNPKPDVCQSSNESGGGNIDLLPCEWRYICDNNSYQKWVSVSPISGYTTIMVNNKSVSLQAAGNYDVGIPPVYIGWKEPLDVRIIEARANSQRINDLIVDGVTRHTFVVEATFAGLPVPDGTPVILQVIDEGQSIVRLSNCVGIPECSPSSNGIIYTRQVNDSILNPTGNKRSLAYFSIEPLEGSVQFYAKILVRCSYDKLGTVSRTIERCIEINNTINSDENPETNPTIANCPNPPCSNPQTTSVTTNELVIYDTIHQSIGTANSSQLHRMSHFVSYLDTTGGFSMYVFGGFTGGANSSTAPYERLSNDYITPTCEELNLITMEWEFITNMPTPRCSGMTASKNGIIYCIGGIERDEILSQYTVSRKIEAYNTDSGSWDSTLSSMPEEYGVAFGTAQIVGDYIYVTCGINTIINNSQPDKLNDRILRYSITKNKWDIITPNNVATCQRISPFGFYRSNDSSGYGDSNSYYVVCGSSPKGLSEIDAERSAIIDQKLSDLKSETEASLYFSKLTLDEQSEFLSNMDKQIRSETQVSPFEYFKTGFKFVPGTEFESGGTWLINIISIDDEWKIMPFPRDRGQSVYIPHQDVVYFIGGSNQNFSTTLSKVEAIDLRTNSYSVSAPLKRGKSMFGAVAIDDSIYISGGFTSGHREGFVRVSVQAQPDLVLATGVESSGIVVALYNDSGEIINDDVVVSIRGQVRIKEITTRLIDFLSKRGADRALGGDGTGTATIPAGDEIDYQRLIDAQNTVVDPNSDEFQFNAVKNLENQLYLLPVIFTEQNILVSGGSGGATVFPRSEDPLSGFNKMGDFITQILQNIPENSDETFEGGLTRDEMAALGDVLNTIDTPTTTIDAGSLRDLYDIEIIATVVDDYYFGQTISGFDLELQTSISYRIVDLLTPDTTSDGGVSGIEGSGIPPVEAIQNSTCFVLQHLAQPDVPSSSTPTPSEDSPNNTGGYGQSGQSLWSSSLIPLNTQRLSQLYSPSIKYYNVFDWIPQIRKYLYGNNSSISDVLSEINQIKYDIPFGASNLYSALSYSSEIMSNEDIIAPKSIYVCSDNEENTSSVTRDQSIESINSIDGNRNTPVVYVLFSTARPQSLSSKFNQVEVGDIEKIVKNTGGQAVVLISSLFLDQILNLTIGAAVGGLGYGIYTRTIDFGEITAFTSMMPTYSLPLNTNGYIRFRYSEDGHNFTDWTEKFIGNDISDFVQFFAQIIEIEITLMTGFSLDTSEEYDTTPTGIPQLVNIVWDISSEKEDYIYLNEESTISNIQQIAVAMEGHVPDNALIDIGVATSVSTNWSDFESKARPSVREYGKIVLLNRINDAASIVSAEKLTTKDQKLYSSEYGSWDPNARITVYEKVSGGYTEILSGFKLFPRQGQIYFDTRQNPDKYFYVQIINDNTARVGVKIRNRLHNDSVTVSGVGYIYNTNNVRPAALAQVAPQANNLSIQPAEPSAVDDIFAVYSYIDLNGNVETGSIITWYKNSRVLLEIQNKSSWNNVDLLPSNKLEPNDKIYFTVSPSDGIDFGQVFYSPSVLIVPQRPSVDDVRIVPIRNQSTNDRYDTGSIFELTYIFRTEDIGAQSTEDGTRIEWFVNGVSWKVGTFSASNPPDEFDDSNNALPVPYKIIPGEVNNGVSAHIIGNQIYVEVTPKNASSTGNVVRSSTITVENAVPIVVSAEISPSNPTSQSTLVVDYTIDDPDMSVGVQTDQSDIKWFKSLDGIDFSEAIAVANKTSVLSDMIRTGEKWYCEIYPFDGLDTGTTKRSATVTIR